MRIKRNKSREELQFFRKFLNKNRGWLCLGNCKVGPECEYCTLIFQINYSYSCNKKANMNTFRKSVLKENFDRLVEIYEDYKIDRIGLIIITTGQMLKRDRYLDIIFHSFGIVKYFNVSQVTAGHDVRDFLKYFCAHTCLLFEIANKNYLLS